VTVSILLVVATISGPLVFHDRAGASADRFGMNTLSVMSGNPSQVGAILDQMRTIGVRWIRADFEWSGIEGTQGNFTWNRADVAVDQAGSHDINVLATLDYTPAWARTNQTSDHYPPDDPNDYADFAKAAALRYKDRVHYWEIWNEPNLWRFWLPRPDVPAYTRLLRKAYAAIKSVDPAATVMVGGLTVSGGNNLSTSFLQRIYDHNGGTSKGLFDAVAWHPYCRTKRPTRSTDSWCAWYQMDGATPSGRSIMVAHGDGAKQIWPTEYGVGTGGTGHLDATQTRQAADLRNAYNRAGQLPYLGPLFWYNWQDSTSDQSQPSYNFCGLTTTDGTKKIAWNTYHELATVMAGP
jgi:polysaccharide biosynthesis protein PslG